MLNDIGMIVIINQFISIGRWLLLLLLLMMMKRISFIGGL